eukprot:270886-Rhodomonas_salina.3
MELPSQRVSTLVSVRCQPGVVAVAFLRVSAIKVHSVVEAYDTCRERVCRVRSAELGIRVWGLVFGVWDEGSGVYRQP